MEISYDVYSLKLLKDGTTTSTIVRNSSLFYLNKLKQYNLVSIDNNEKVYLTEKGHLAKKIGLNKFIELEKLEKELVNVEPGELASNKKGYLIIMFCLQIFLLLIVAYIFIN